MPVDSLAMISKPLVLKVCVVHPVQVLPHAECSWDWFQIQILLKHLLNRSILVFQYGINVSLCAAGSPFSLGGSSGGSPYHPSTSSREGSPRSPSPRRCTRRDTPELGEASDDEPHMVMSFTLSTIHSVGHSDWRSLLLLL